MSTSSSQSASADAENPRSDSCSFDPSAKKTLLILLLVIVFFGCIRYRLRDMPLERDEGEYAYSGQLLLDGIPPYKLAYNMKLPGIYAAYAVIMAVFGQNPAAIHVGLLLLNAASIGLLYLLATRMLGRLAGLVAAASFALLSTSSSVMGFEAHATNFVVLPALVGMLFAVEGAASESKSLILLSGLFCGIAVLMKQHAMFFVAFCMLYLGQQSWPKHRSMAVPFRSAGSFAIGAASPYILTCLLMYRAGVFKTFWLWTFSYANEYSKIGLRRAVHAFAQNATQVGSPAVALWIFSGIGLSVTFWNRNAARHRFFLITLFLFSFLSICPGGYFRPHYFVLLLPIVAILIGFVISTLAERLANHGTQFASIPVLIFLLAYGWSVIQQRQQYFSMSPDAVFRVTYPGGLFEAARDVADYLRHQSTAGTRIAVIGSEPEIYFYAHRHSATGFIYMYSLVGHQKYLERMQDQMLGELRENRPEYLVYIDAWDSWGDRVHAPEAVKFLESLNAFMNSDYDEIGVADLGPATGYVWGEAARSYVPKSGEAVYVLKRRTLQSAGMLS